MLIEQAYCETCRRVTRHDDCRFDCLIECAECRPAFKPMLTPNPLTPITEKPEGLAED